MWKWRSKPKRLIAIDDVCENTGRGIYKRIDENRELLELLLREAPELLDRCFWIIGWLENQDHFLVSLAQAAEIENSYPLIRNFPRPMPTVSMRNILRNLCITHPHAAQFVKD